MDIMLFDLYFIPKMAAGNTSHSLGLQLPTWSTSLLEGSQHFVMYALINIAFSITLYYPLYILYLMLVMGNTYCTICRKLYDLPNDIRSKRWIKPRKTLALVLDVTGKLLHGEYLVILKRLYFK